MVSTAAAVDQIRKLIGERITTNASILEQHGHDESWHEWQPPEAVCFVESTEEVKQIVRICNANSVPVIPFGTGTGVAGLVNAVCGGITINVSRMDKVLALHTEDFNCRVQAGLTYKRLNQYLRDTGLFFSVDPGADASLGGMAATRASGTNTVRYGIMDGTCTGEHGIGLQKMKYMADEFGEDCLSVMREIKLALDPRGLMNPGKKLPRQDCNA
jgi:D-lactate dehydrogenase (cytochrome)